MLDIFFIFYFYFFFVLSTKKKKLPGHHHLLLSDQYIKTKQWCSECDDGIYEDDCNYCCKFCDEWWHKKCMPSSSKLVNHPFHPHHALKLLVGGAHDFVDGECYVCRGKLKQNVYHCSICDFSLDVTCGHSPIPVKIDESKSHNHPLTLMLRQVSFVCNACGMHGDGKPYVCLACSFMVHEECINLPHVIIINHHDHRISHTYSLGPGNTRCQVCRLKINWIYGAYSCSECPDFVVHSKCATNPVVWDCEELEGIPEEEEDEPMFKVIEENVINHVKHPSHNLTLIDDSVVRLDDVRCQLCDGAVYSDKFYKCLECDYILHEACSYHSKRKRLGFSRSPLSLEAFVINEFKHRFFECSACQQLSTGYMYTVPLGLRTIDLRCATVDWSCDHECHPHTLYLTNLEKDTCGACNSKGYVLRCVDCKFNLCYKCASYPMKLKHRCDDHILMLSFGDKDQHGTTWCTICETKIDLEGWFYECEECGIVCHIYCVLGDFANCNPGLFTKKGESMEGVVRNNSSTRPHCSVCASRCLTPFIYSLSDNFICSLACLEVGTVEL